MFWNNQEILAAAFKFCAILIFLFITLISGTDDTREIQDGILKQAQNRADRFKQPVMWPKNHNEDELIEQDKTKKLEDVKSGNSSTDTGDLENVKNTDSSKDSRVAFPSYQTDVSSIRQKSASRDSSLNDDPRSLLDSISNTSGRQNWCAKETAEYDPSISSIKGDSVSATIADYNRKHLAQTLDNQSRTSGPLGATGEPSSRTDDLSSNINFYPAGGSTSGIGNAGVSTRSGDVGSVSNANVDAFDIIEENSDVSSIGGLTRLALGGKAKIKNQRNQPLSSLERALEIDDLPQASSVYQIEPIIIRGNGNLTLFGLSNSFSADFPPTLIGRVSREEFNHTMQRINTLLRNQQSLSAKLLLFGGLCCCCSLGFSLVWPSIALRKRSKMTLQKFLASENSRLYSQLGLNWKLADQRCYSNHAFLEYVLMIEFSPKINLYLPD